MKTGARLITTLKVVVYAALLTLGLQLFPLALLPLFGYLAGAAMTTFAAGASANALCVRIFGIAGQPLAQPRLSDIGLGWSPASSRNLLIGAAGGSAAALLVVGLPLLAGVAYLKPTPDSPGSVGSALFVTIALVFGAVGEEMMFRGYAFQLLAGVLGRFATILPTAALFGFMHSRNQNFSNLGFLNTVLWGIVFGYAMVRAADLWLPIGLHFGWNVVLPLFGASLSGFRMGVSGRALEWNAGVLWSGGSYGPEASLLTTLAVIGVFVYVMRVPVQRQHAPLLSKDEDE